MRARRDAAHRLRRVDGRHCRGLLFRGRTGRHSTGTRGRIRAGARTVRPARGRHTVRDQHSRRAGRPRCTRHLERDRRTARTLVVLRPAAHRDDARPRPRRRPRLARSPAAGPTQRHDRLDPRRRRRGRQHHDRSQHLPRRTPADPARRRRTDRRARGRHRPPRTPTPPGIYYVTDPVDLQINPTSVYGAYAIGLSGFSEVLDSFDGGPPQLAIHGTPNPEQMGQDISNGCIRLPDEVVLAVAEHVELGTPVHIHP